MTGQRSGSFRPRPSSACLGERRTTNAATVPSEPSPAIEFWFEFGSNYSYLSVMRIEDAARRYGVRIAWKPFLLGPIFRALGMETSPFLQQKEKGAYVWQDMARQCRKYGLRWTMPSIFPRLGVLPARVALIGAEEPWIGAFCRTVMELNFALDEDINQPERLASILIDLNLPASEILDQAEAEPVKALLRRADGNGARQRNIRRAHFLRRARDVLGQRSFGRRSPAGRGAQAGCDLATRVNEEHPCRSASNAAIAS